MLEWNEAVQKMIDLIEANIGEDFSLVELSRRIGYSPYYCSVRFHQVCGMTIKSYVAHPQFDFLTDNTDVMGRVESIAWNYDIKNFHGGDYEWNESCQCYQRHYPEGIGYEILRPIRLKNK